MRKYVVGDGWRFELIDDELYFARLSSQWNYNLSDLIITYRNRAEVIYITDKEIQLLLKICLYEEMFPTWSRITLVPTKKQFIKIKELLL